MSQNNQNMSNNSQSRPQHYDESLWVKRMEKTLDDELEEEAEIPVTIFAVPKALMMTDPDSYIPQQVAIGPYHHLRAEVYDMEKYKIAAAKRNQKEISNLKLKHLVEHLLKLDAHVRASYHRPVGFGPEALAWMMALDASFLFEFLQVCAVKSGKMITRIPSRMAHLIDLSGNKTAHNEILRDIIMLENQIPLIVMRKLYELQLTSLEMADERVLAILTGLSKNLSPFNQAEEEEATAVSDCAHLLEFLYNYIVSKADRAPSSSLEIDIEEEGEGGEKEGEDGEEKLTESTHVTQLKGIVWPMVAGAMKKPIKLVKAIIFSKPLKLVVKLPWTIISNIPILKAFKQPLENMFNNYSNKKDDGEGGDDDEEANKKEKPPLQEEIKIPSVTQLIEAGVQLRPSSSGISSFAFDEKTLTLHIPVVRIDVNTEVVLRNLVAYEACAAEGAMVLARYTELMNGIIDTEEDARELCGRGIINNHLKSEKEVAELWNGMSKSVRLTRVPSLDAVIAAVNGFYSRRWKVRMAMFMRDYVFGSWRILTFLAAVVMVALMCLQSFCQVYSCHRVLQIKGLEPEGA